METTKNSEKIDTFLKEYGELVTKHGVDFINFPMFSPDGNGGWKIIIHTQPVETKESGIKSPFIA